MNHVLQESLPNGGVKNTYNVGTWSTAQANKIKAKLGSKSANYQCNVVIYDSQMKAPDNKQVQLEFQWNRKPAGSDYYVDELIGALLEAITK